MFEGVEISVWTHAQLEKLGRDALKNRALNMRSSVGKERLPNMPQHPEGLIRWIIEVQAAMTKGSAHELTPYDFGLPVDAQAPPASPASQAGHNGPVRNDGPARRGSGYSSAAGTDAGDAQDAFQDARAAREAAKQRNQGSGIF